MKQTSNQKQDESKPSNTSNSRFYANQPSQDKTNEQVTKLLMDDPNIFAYDEIYDDMKRQKEVKVAQAKLAPSEQAKPTSKYIRSIVNTVGKRQREYEIVHEKMVSKKVKKDMEGAPQEIFVTSSYLKQKEAEKAFEQEQKKAEEYNEKHSINNKDRNQYQFTAQLFRSEFADSLKSELPKPAQEEKPAQPKPKFYSEKAHQEKQKQKQTKGANGGTSQTKKE